jgi:hypothetical protein
MRSADRDAPELIPYASHVAHGTGRTPIGIILFAASHLLLGGVIVFALVRLLRIVPRGAWSRNPEDLIWPILAAVLATSMIAGGIALLLKGRSMWITAVASFGCLATAEAFAAVVGLLMFVRGGRDAQTWAKVQSVVTTLLLAMSCVVLGYLASANARRTFGLPPGETSAAVRWLPRMILVAFMVAAVFVVTL